jgi:hypothetical protein
MGCRADRGGKGSRQLFLFLLQSFFLSKCFCVFTYRISFGNQPDEGAYEGKANTKPNGSSLG